MKNFINRQKKLKQKELYLDMVIQTPKIAYKLNTNRRRQIGLRNFI